MNNRRIFFMAVVAVFLSASEAAAEGHAPRELAFDPDVHAGRRAVLMQKVRNAPVIVPGAYLVKTHGVARQDPNFWYLTGVESPYAILVMVPAGDGRREVLFLPRKYQFAPANYPQRDARFREAVWNRPIDRLVPGDAAKKRTGIDEIYFVDEFAQRVSGIIGEAEIIYFASDRQTYYAPPGLSAPRSIRQQLESAIASILPEATMEDVTPLIRRMRMVKDEHELARMRKAADISALSLMEAARAIEPGKNALEIAGLMEYVWKREGSQSTGHPPMVAVGDHSLVMYALQYERYNNANRIMKAGELVYIDYGVAEYDMYASDVCRTFPVSGTFTPEQRKYYEIVVEASEAAMTAIHPGATMRDVIVAAARVFKEHGLDKYEDVERMGVDKVWGVFPSPTHYLTETGGEEETGSPPRARGLGHNIGLDVAWPFDPDIVLEPGMVFTVEPKLYIPELGTGMMVEDVVVVTEDGHENLSARVPTSADAIEALMAEASAISP